MRSETALDPLDYCVNDRAQVELQVSPRKAQEVNKSLANTLSVTDTELPHTNKKLELGTLSLEHSGDNLGISYIICRRKARPCEGEWDKLSPRDTSNSHPCQTQIYCSSKVNVHLP